jgi:signal transduction histidine kinase
MRRLYKKIYLTVIVSLVIVVAVSGAIWRIGWQYSPAGQAFQLMGELVAAALPPADAPPAEQQRAVERLSERLDADLALYDVARRLVAAAGAPLPSPFRHGDRGGWVYGPDGPAWSLALPDGRWIVARPPLEQRRPGVRIVFLLALIAVLVGLSAYPVARGLTRRLERLQEGVETLGAGNLSARVKVEGRDEVARLAESFNRAAARIEELVGAHRLLLANASHELRTPLSRIRLAVELFQATGDEKYKADLQRDIAELDSLIDEILLASRLEANPALGAVEDVDPLALAAEEAAHYEDCTVAGEPAAVRGDARLLRRLIRNLLENARRHGRPPVQVLVTRSGPQAVIEVADAGAGVPPAAQERIFSPFQRLGGDAQGAGLGLALVRQIARLHGGDAVVAPRADAPSCFRVTFRAAAPRT